MFNFKLLSLEVTLFFMIMMPRKKQKLPSNEQAFLDYLTKEKEQLDFFYLSRIIYNVYGKNLDMGSISLFSFLLSVIFGTYIGFGLNIPLEYPFLASFFISIITYVLLLRI